MACVTGIHCATGPGAWAFTDEEPPASLTWFMSAFVGVLYTRSAIGTLAFFFIFRAFFEAVHLVQAWATTDRDGGPLDHDPGGALGLVFGRHPVADSLLITYPLFAVFGAWFAHVLCTALDTSVYLQSYFKVSPRARRTGCLVWLSRQVKYSTQLFLVAYFPSTLAFGFAAASLGDDRRVEILLVWVAAHLLLVGVFWWWNLEELDVVWRERAPDTASAPAPATQQLSSPPPPPPPTKHPRRWQPGELARIRHNQFYGVWAGVCVLVWVPVVALSGTAINSQFRLAIGVAAVFVVSAPALPRLLPSSPLRLRS
jgi:hypothetical protein